MYKDCVNYTYLDTACGQRIHWWHYNDRDSYAKGFGPIETISEEEFWLLWIKSMVS